MMQPATIRGGCLCGAVRFEADPPSNWCAHCHCEYCRSAYGAAFVTWFGVPESGFRIVSGEETLRWFSLTAEARRGFCGTCGSMLLFAGDRWPGEIHVARASVEGDIDREPQAHAYADRKVEWVTLHDDLPRFGGPTGTEPLETAAQAGHRSSHE